MRIIALRLMTWQTTIHDIRTWAFMGACDITPKNQAFLNLGRGCNNRFGEGNGCIPYARFCYIMLSQHVSIVS